MTLHESDPEQLARIVTEGVPSRGMPAIEVPEAELAPLVAYLKELAAAAPPASRDPRAPQPRADSLPLVGGGTLDGTVLNESGFDAQLRTAAGDLVLLRREGDAFREAAVEPFVDWPSYHGGDTGNRHSPLDQIGRNNVGELALQWFFPIPDMPMIEGTPVVIAGVMYVTAVNQVYALDAATGREIWRYAQPRTDGLVGDPAIGLNRGVAVRGGLVFSVTDHAHVIALDRFTGELVWDTEMDDYREHYGAVVAPLVVGDLVIAGISAGDTGLRGFLDAYHGETGERAWRHWTIPAPGEPGSETWGDPEVLRRGCGATWLTGSFDAELDLLYWATGNPCPDMNGDRRPGDNLWTNSVLALRPETGELVWYFQFTPHDTHDWDAQEPLLLIDEEFRGRPRKLLVQGNRNGFFYVLDRTTGQFLLGGPFVNQTWAAGLDDSGRPIGPARQRADRGGHRRLSGHLRGDELVVVELPPGDEALLPDGPRIVRHLYEGGRGVAARPQLDGRRHPPRRRRPEPEVHPCARHPDRPHGVELPADGGGAHLFGGHLDGRGRRFLRREQRRVRRPRRPQRRAALARPDQPGVAGLAHDLPGRRPAVRRHRVEARLLVVRAPGTRLGPSVSTWQNTRTMATLSAPMTPYQFINKWQGAALKERSGSQEHFLDLCRLLDEPTPAEADPSGATYCFERGRGRTPAATAGLTSGSGTTSRGNTRGDGRTSTPRSTSCGSTRWRWRTRRC